jgi:hypothetical protein
MPTSSRFHPRASGGSTPARNNASLMPLAAASTAETLGCSSASLTATSANANYSA